MRRSWFTAAAAALVLAIGTVGAAAPAAAAPPESDWEASASADVVALSLSTLGITLTELGVATSATATGTTLAPQATSQSANLSADVLGLGIGVVENTQTAPPTTAPTGLDLLAVNAAILNLGALTSTNEANWTVDEACVTEGVLAQADTQIAGIDVLAGTVEVGAASVTSTTRLALNSGANYGVQSIATGSIAGLSLLNEAIGIEVIGTPTLTATSTGTTDSVAYTPATVNVTFDGVTSTLTPGVAFPLTVGTTQVSITVNEPPTTGTASASFDFLSISIDSLLGTDVTLGVLPLSVDATAPAGGIDCPPPAPAILAPAAGSTTADSTPTISGTALPGATVTVTLDGNPLAPAVTADAGGNWSLMAPTLGDGLHTVSATQTVNGQISPPSADVSFTVDTTAPAAPVVVAPANGSSTADNTPTVSGTAVPGSTVTVSIDGSAIAPTATADGSGNWSVTAPTLADGSHTVNAVAADAVGNTSPVSNTNTFTVDTTAPAPPVVVTPANGSSTNDNTPTISGTAVPGSTVTASTDGSVITPTTTADGSGNWTLTAPTLADGSHTVNAVAADALGNTSPVSNTNTFTVDTAAPVAPVVSTPANGSTISDNTPTITGTGEPNATIRVSIDGSPLVATTTAGAGGNWSLASPVLDDGSHTVNATATDAAGNVSPVSNTNTFTVDTTAPDAPVVVAPANGSTTADSTPTISGTAVPGSTVTVRIDGSAIAPTTTVDGSGNWSLTAPTLADGSHTVNAVAAAVGNTSPVSNTNTFTVDTTAPAAPIVVTPADGSTTGDSTPTISGTAVPGSTVRVSVDGGELATTATTDGSGNWSLTAPTLADGSHTVNAVAAAVGNTSPVSNTNTFTVDTTAPAAPVVVTPADGSTTGDSTPTISGTAVAGSTVTVRIDGSAIAPAATADGSGNWTVTAPTLADGAHTVNAVAADAVGNTSPVSNTNTFTVDTTAPAAPVVVTPADGSTTADDTPTVSGTAEAGATVTVSIDGAAIVPAATADGSGNWSVTAPTLADGAHTVNAVATDAGGNTSPVSNTNTFTVDTAAPAAPVITTPVNNAVLNDATPPIGGTAEAGATVTVTIDGVVAGTTTATGGNWTFTPGEPLADGPHTVVATAADAAGNTSGPSDAVAFVVDTAAPAAPIITSPANDDVLTDSTPTITGSAEADSTVTVIIDGEVAGTTTADGTGAWSFTPASPLADGEHTVTATARDAAGNTGPEAEEVIFTIDTVAPLAPVITAPVGGSTTNDATPPIAGTAEPGSTVTVVIDGTTAGTTTADGTGAWTFTPASPLADGEHTVSATATDAAGQVSPASDEVAFTVDTTPPAAPIITSPQNGATTDDATPPVTGTAEPGSTVAVIIDGTLAGSTTANGQGAWTFTPTSPLGAGAHTITASATDAAGNVGPASAPVTVTVRALAPVSPAAPASSGLAATGGTTPLAAGTFGMILLALGLITLRSRHRRVS